jgi:uncharacterized protein (TIGR02271 family)
VLVDGYTAAQVGALPRHGGRLTREYETSLLGGSPAAGSPPARSPAGRSSAAPPRPRVTSVRRATDDRLDYDADAHRHHYDDQRLFAARRARAEQRGTAETTDHDATRLTLSRSSCRSASARWRPARSASQDGRDEHVREQVALRHDEVTVERHALQRRRRRQRERADRRGEIRVPLTREEAVVEKRVVPREEIVVRKHAVQEDRAVEADLRRERVQVDDGRVAGASGATSGATSGGATSGGIGGDSSTPSTT